MKEIYILKEPLGKIGEPKEVFKKIEKFKIDHTQENFIVFGLNNQNQPVKSKVLFKGSDDSCLIDPKFIFKFALINDCNKVIIAHNHPSNNLKPSEEDKVHCYLKGW